MGNWKQIVAALIFVFVHFFFSRTSDLFDYLTQLEDGRCWFQYSPKMNFSWFYLGVNLHQIPYCFDRNRSRFHVLLLQTELCFSKVQAAKKAGVGAFLVKWETTPLFVAWREFKLWDILDLAFNIFTTSSSTTERNNKIIWRVSSVRLRIRRIVICHYSSASK